MSIYPSFKPAPYVYICTHRVTGQFYIGSRYQNVTLFNRTSDVDFPQYKTSSKKVKPIFDEFDWVIIAEFFDSDSAYDFEHKLIREYWENSLLLNGVCWDGPKRFKIPKERSPEHIAKIAASNKGKKHTLEQRAALSKAKTGKKIHRSPEHNAKIASALLSKKHSQERRAICASGHKGIHLSPEHREAIRVASLGKKRGPYKRKIK